MWLHDRLDKGFELSTVLSEMLQFITDKFSKSTNLKIVSGQKLPETRHLLISNQSEAAGVVLATIALKQIHQCDEDNLKFFSILLPVLLFSNCSNSKLHTKIASVTSPEDAEALSELESFERGSAESAPIKAVSHKIERPQDIKNQNIKELRMTQRD